jgi:heme exporter protein D
LTLEPVTDFLAMGGYAAYVWPALAVAALVMAALYVESRHALGAREAELEALQRARADAETAEAEANEGGGDEA